MKLKNASENFVVPPIGRYKAKIVASETKTAASSGAPMIAITGEIREPADYAGAQFFDNMITDESFKGSGFGKKKLRGLGIPVDSEQEILDSQIATHLLGLEIWVDLDHEQIMDKDAGTGEYSRPRTNMENGRQVPAMKLVPKGYYTSNVGAAPQAPVQQLQAPVQTSGFVQQAAPFAQPTGGFPVGAQAFPPAPVQQLQAPQGGGFPGFPAAPQAVAPNGAPPAQPLPWAQPPQAQQTQADTSGGGGGKKRGAK